MNNITRLILLISVLSVFGCQKENMGDCFKSTGSIVEEIREVSPFTHIKLYDRINLYIKFDSIPSLVVKAGENLQEHIETKIENNTLAITNSNRCNWVRSFKKDIDVYLTTPDIRSMEIYGSGKLQFIDTLHTASFIINMFQASGDVYLKLKTPYAELKSHTGTGTITASGTVDDLVTFMGGNGFVDASAINSRTGLAVSTNTGYVRINSSDYLKADISGSGDIEYYGNPTIDLIDTGKGKLVQR